MVAQTPITKPDRGPSGDGDDDDDDAVHVMMLSSDDIVTQCAFVLGKSPPFTPPGAHFNITHLTFPLCRALGTCNF